MTDRMETNAERRKREAKERRDQAKREARIQDEVRRRLADAMASAGVDKGRVALEVLYLLPDEFIRAYAELFSRALDMPDAIRAGNPDDVQIRRTHRDQHGLARKKGTHKGFWLVRDEVALKRKGRIDRKLRRLIPEMYGANEGKAGTGIHCGRCGRFIEQGWQYCPWDGEEVRGNEEGSK